MSGEENAIVQRERELVGLLLNPNATMDRRKKIDAIDKLAEIGTPSALSAVVEMLSEELPVRMAAGSALRRTGENVVHAIPELVRVMRSNNEDAAEAAVFSLFEMGGRGIMEIFDAIHTERLRELEEREGTRPEDYAFIGRFSFKVQRAIEESFVERGEIMFPWLLSMEGIVRHQILQVQREGGEVPGILLDEQDRICTMIHRIEGRREFERTLEGRIAQLHEGTRKQKVMAMHDLRRILRNEECDAETKERIYSAFVTALGDELVVRFLVAKALMEAELALDSEAFALGSPLTPHLVSALDSTNPDAREAACFALEPAAIKMDEAAILALIKRFSDVDFKVETCAAESLAMASLSKEEFLGYLRQVKIPGTLKSFENDPTVPQRRLGMIHTRGEKGKIEDARGAFVPDSRVHLQRLFWTGVMRSRISAREEARQARTELEGANGSQQIGGMNLRQRGAH